jgi:hypothetical protein
MLTLNREKEVRIPIRMTVFVDPKAYREEYADEYTLDEIREMVRMDVHDAVENATQFRLGKDVFPRIESR